VGYRKIKLDAKCSPSPSVSNPSLLDGGVRVEHGLAAYFVHAGVKMATDIREHGTLQVFVLEINGSPLVFGPAVGYFISECIGIVKAPRRKLIKSRIGVRRSLLVRRKF